MLSHQFTALAVCAVRGLKVVELKAQAVCDLMQDRMAVRRGLPALIRAEAADALEARWFAVRAERPALDPLPTHPVAANRKTELGSTMVPAAPPPPVVTVSSAQNVSADADSSWAATTLSWTTGSIELAERTHLCSQPPSRRTFFCGIDHPITISTGRPC